MTDNEIVDSSFTATIDAPIERIDLPEWCFTLRTDAKISDAVCWNEQGGMPSVWRSQIHHLFLRLS